ncbi:hypothetical protein AURDEDRAFT_46805, partial [Auricularia subglabra TFB-10046 SS5]
GLHLLRKHLDFGPSTLGLDNTPVISATHHVRPRPGQYLINEIHNAARHVVRKGALSMTWTPGHEGILGNETADAAAKLAATGPAASSSDRRLPRILRQPLPLSSSALKQAHTADLKAAWTRLWSQSPRYRRYAHLNDHLTPTKCRRLLLPMARRHMSAVTQLRTGHAPLNGHLNRINRSDSAACPSCNHRRETVRHFVLDCPG